MFLEYYLTFKHTSWLTNVCSSLARSFTVVSFKICNIGLERSPFFKFAKIISKRSPFRKEAHPRALKRKEAHLEKKPIQGP